MVTRPRGQPIALAQKGSVYGERAKAVRKPRRLANRDNSAVAADNRLVRDIVIGVKYES